MSKWGEGTGVPMSACADPNKPSYDPATRLDDTARKVMWLCENAWDRMTKWERDFCQVVYCAFRLSRKQHLHVWALHKKYSSNGSGEPQTTAGGNAR